MDQKCTLWERIINDLFVAAHAWSLEQSGSELQEMSWISMQLMKTWEHLCSIYHGPHTLWRGRCETNLLSAGQNFPQQQDRAVQSWTLVIAYNQSWLVLSIFCSSREFSGNWQFVHCQFCCSATCHLYCAFHLNLSCHPYSTCAQLVQKGCGGYEHSSETIIEQNVTDMVCTVHITTTEERNKEGEGRC